jgi:hypothetical protein
MANNISDVQINPAVVAKDAQDIFCACLAQLASEAGVIGIRRLHG